MQKENFKASPELLVQMKFFLDHVATARGRLGQLFATSRCHDYKLRTPMLVLTTQTGSVPHLTKDAFGLVAASSRKQEEQILATAQLKNSSEQTPDLQPSTHVLSVPVVHFMESHETLLSYKQGVASFAGLNNHKVLATAQCCLTEVRGGYNNTHGISLWPHCGRVALKPEEYLRRVGALRATWCEALHDADTPRGCSSKRLYKSLLASYEYLDTCLSLVSATNGCGTLLVPLLGGWDAMQRRRWTKKVEERIKKENKISLVGGYSISGLHSYGSSAENIEPDAVFLDCLQASLSGTDSSLPRFALGSYNPLTALALVGAGVDVLDSSLAAVAANRHCALVFSFTADMLKLRLEDLAAEVSTSSAGCVGATDGAGASDSQPQKRKRHRRGSQDLTSADEVSDVPRHPGNGGSPVAERPYEINLSSERYRGSGAGLLRGCCCYACSSGYTRGYIHHLCSTGEMLAPVLLHMHNLHHLLGFMTAIRAAVATDALENTRSILVQSLRPSTSIKCPDLRNCSVSAEPGSAAGHPVPEASNSAKAENLVDSKHLSEHASSFPENSFAHEQEKNDDSTCDKQSSDSPESLSDPLTNYEDKGLSEPPGSSAVVKFQGNTCTRDTSSALNVEGAEPRCSSSQEVVSPSLDGADVEEFGGVNR